SPICYHAISLLINSHFIPHYLHNRIRPTNHPPQPLNPHNAPNPCSEVLHPHIYHLHPPTGDRAFQSPLLPLIPPPRPLHLPPPPPLLCGLHPPPRAHG